jgi:hypothetical protein
LARIFPFSHTHDDCDGDNGGDDDGDGDGVGDEGDNKMEIRIYIIQRKEYRKSINNNTLFKVDSSFPVRC